MSEPVESGMRRTVAQVALAVSLVAAAFILVVCALLTATHLQLKKADPLNNETLVAMRDRYAVGEKSDQAKADIRQLDLLSRKAFFTSQSQIVTGGVVAVVAAAFMLLAFGVYKAATSSVPPANGENCDGIFWTGIERSRAWVAGGAVVLVAVSVVMTVSTPTELSVEKLASVDKPTPVASPDKVPAPAAVANVPPIFPAGFAENAPVFRGAEGSGRTAFADVVTEWDEPSGKNLLWKKALELPAWAAPVVWDDKVIALGAGKEKRVVYCLNAGSGDEVWTTEVPVHKDATENYATDTMDERWNRLVYAGATPAVNGKQVFAIFSNGQLVALDLATGNVLWNNVLGQTKSNTYGLDSSLLIYRDSVIVVFQGDEMFVARYDAATGKEIWKTERKSSSWASPILATLSEDSYLIVLSGDPDLTAWDPETGKEAWSSEMTADGVDYCVGPSAVQVGDRVCVNMQQYGIFGFSLSAGTMAWKIDELPDGSGFSDGASMTTDGKYIYQFYASSLTCVDPKDGKIVKQKEMDEYANYASPVVNGGNLYLPGDGVMLVVKADPATDFEQVGKGSMVDSSDATPTVTKGRVYIRSDESLYCFGK